MASERFIDLQLIKPLTKGNNKGKISLTNLFKEYFDKLKVGYVDTCCPAGSPTAYGCPAISAADGNTITCNPDGIFSAGGGGGVGSGSEGLSIEGLSVVLGQTPSAPGDPAALSGNREIPMNNHLVNFKGGSDDTNVYGGEVFIVTRADQNTYVDLLPGSINVSTSGASDVTTISLYNDTVNSFDITYGGSSVNGGQATIQAPGIRVNAGTSGLKVLGSMSVGMSTNPTALLDIAAAPAVTAGNAPLKFHAGAVLTTPEAGAVEFDGTHFYITIGSTRTQLDNFTVNNGLTTTAGVTGLGGTLTSSPTIAAGSNALTITGTRANFNQPALQLTNNSGGAALQITGTGIPAYINVTGGAGSYGLYIQQLGTNQNADAARFEASGSAKALECTAIGGIPVAIYSTPTGTLNSATEILRLSKNTAGTTDGNGMYIQMIMNSFSGPGGLPVVKFEGVLTDSTAGGLASQINLHTYGTGSASGTTRAVLTLKGSGQWLAPLYGVGTFTGTYSRTLAVDATGNFIETLSPVITSGTTAPATTPGKVGDIFVDTTGKKMYIATGNASSADWTITN